MKRLAARFGGMTIALIGAFVLHDIPPLSWWHIAAQLGAALVFTIGLDLYHWGRSEDA